MLHRPPFSLLSVCVVAAAAAAKWLQSCPTLCDPIDGSPPGSRIPGILQAWETDGETVETVSDFIFLGSKITAGGDCSHEIKRRLLLRRKVMTNLDSVIKTLEGTRRVGGLLGVAGKKAGEGGVSTAAQKALERKAGPATSSQHTQRGCCPDICIIKRGGPLPPPRRLCHPCPAWQR